jgi:O-antigen/teichoic acid export membrane protein
MLRKLLSLLSDSVIYGASNMLSQIVGFFLLPLYTKTLTTQEYGVISMLQISGMLFAPIATLGLTNATFRRYSQAKDEQGKSEVLSTGLVATSVGVIVAMFVAACFAPLIASRFVGDATTTYLVLLSLFATAFSLMTHIPSGALRVQRRVRLLACITLLTVIASIGSTIVLVLGFKLGVKGWILGGMAGDVLFGILAFWCTRKQMRLRFSVPMWKSMLSYGLPLVPHRLMSVAMAQFSVVMVNEMLGLGEAGIYSIATRFAMPVGLIVNAIQEAWQPYKFELHGQEADPAPFFSSLFTYYLSGISYLWVGVAWWGFVVVPAMVAPEYQTAVLLLPMLALLRATQGVYFMMGTGMELTDRTGALPLISFTGLVVVVISALLLTRPFGALGAAISGVLCNLMMSAVAYQLARRRLKIDYEWPTIIGLSLLATIFVGSAYATAKQSITVQIVLCVAVSLVYPLLVVAILGRSANERHRMLILWERVRGLRGRRAGRIA